jgi:hypothetical protein
MDRQRAVELFANYKLHSAILVHDDFKTNFHVLCDPDAFYPFRRLVNGPLKNPDDLPVAADAGGCPALF